MRKKEPWSWKDKNVIRLSTDLSRENAAKLDEISYITKEKGRKPSSQKIFDWLLNFSKRDEILQVMEEEHLQRELLRRQKK